MRSPRVVIVLLALLMVGTPAVLRARNRPPTQTGRQPSPWVVPRIHPLPKLSAAPAPPEPATKVPRASLVLRVEDVKGGPIPGARISFEGRERGATGERGRLSLDTGALGLPDAGWLRVEASGYGAVERRYAIPDEVRIQLIAGSVLSGRVVQAGTSLGVAGLEVSTGDRSATSDQHGRFTIRDVSTGATRVWARGEGWYGELAQPIRLGLGRTVDNLQIAVSRGFTIRGRVLRRGRPIAGEARVSSSGTTGPTARTSGGRFALVGMAPGSHALTALVEPVDAFFSTGYTALVQVIDRDVEKDLDVGDYHILTVEVVDGAGKPLAGVPIRLMTVGGHDRVRMEFWTDRSGRCAVALGLDEVSVSLRRYQHQERIVAALRNGPVRFVLDGRGTVAGRLVGTDGRPQGRVPLKLAGASGILDAITSRPDGSFRFPLVAAGRFTLSIGHPAETTRLLTLGPGEQRTDLVITLPAENAALAGRVVDAKGTPVPEVLVSREPFDPHSLSYGGFGSADELTVTDRSGAFRVEGLSPARRYNLFAYRITGESAALREVKTGAPVQLRLDPARR